MRDDLLTTQEVADQLKVSVHSVARWARAGVLPSVKVGPKGLHRFRQVDVDDFVTNGGPQPDPAEAAS